MNCQKLTLVTLALFGLGPPTQAQETYYESEVIQEVPLEDGSTLKQVLTTEIIPPDTEDEASYEEEEVVVVPDPDWGEICLIQFSDGSTTYDYVYDAPNGNLWGNPCYAMHFGTTFKGTIAQEADL